MGTWGFGLFDSDAALDEVDTLRRTISLSGPPHEVATSIGLVAWLDAGRLDWKPELMRATIADLLADPSSLPVEARRALHEIAMDPKGVARRRTRPPELLFVLGPYVDGPLFRSLFELPDGRVVVDRFAAACVEAMDAAVAREYQTLQTSDYQSQFGPLGLLVELRRIGVRLDRASVLLWRHDFERVNARTHEQRRFWNEVVPRVRAALDYLLDDALSVAPAPLRRR